MTDPIQPHELSALLDGELDPQRAAEVRLAISNDPTLRAEFERLAADHRRWSELALQAAFTPAVTLAPATQPTRAWPHWSLAAVLATILIVTRFLTKLDIGLVLQFAVHTLILSILVAGLILLNRKLAIVGCASAHGGRSDVR